MKHSAIKQDKSFAFNAFDIVLVVLQNMFSFFPFGCMTSMDTNPENRVIL
jgi:hypothetical protein